MVSGGKFGTVMEQLNSRWQLMHYSANKCLLHLCVPPKGPRKNPCSVWKWVQSSVLTGREHWPAVPFCCVCSGDAGSVLSTDLLFGFLPQHGESLGGTHLQRGLQVLLPLQRPRIHHPRGRRARHLRAHLGVSCVCGQGRLELWFAFITKRFWRFRHEIGLICHPYPSKEGLCRCYWQQ